MISLSLHESFEHGKDGTTLSRRRETKQTREGIQQIRCTGGKSELADEAMRCSIKPKTIRPSYRGRWLFQNRPRKSSFAIPHPTREKGRSSGENLARLSKSAGNSHWYYYGVVVRITRETALVYITMNVNNNNNIN